MEAVWGVGAGLPAAEGATEASPAAAAGSAAAVDEDDEASLCGALFRGLVFYLGREVPREALLLAIRCASETLIASVKPCDCGEAGLALSVSIRKLQRSAATGHVHISSRQIAVFWVLGTRTVKMVQRRASACQWGLLQGSCSLAQAHSARCVSISFQMCIGRSLCHQLLTHFAQCHRRLAAFQ